jgi:hypothetical protein
LLVSQRRLQRLSTVNAILLLSLLERLLRTRGLNALQLISKVAARL